MFTPFAVNCTLPLKGAAPTCVGVIWAVKVTGVPCATVEFEEATAVLVLTKVTVSVNDAEEPR